MNEHDRINNWTKKWMHEKSSKWMNKYMNEWMNDWESEWTSEVSLSNYSWLSQICEIVKNKVGLHENIYKKIYIFEKIQRLDLTSISPAF